MVRHASGICGERSLRRRHREGEHLLLRRAHECLTSVMGEGYREGRAAVFNSCKSFPEPAAALLVVDALAQPHWKIEICATAAKV